MHLYFQGIELKTIGLVYQIQLLGHMDLINEVNLLYLLLLFALQ